MVSIDPMEQESRNKRIQWTRPLRPLLRAGSQLFDRVLCVAGAVLFSQLPEFFQQYLQRLGGHLAEAQRQLEQFRQAAGGAGANLDQFAANVATDRDPAVAHLGRVILETHARVDTLAAAEAALRGASGWSRPFVFLAHVDPGIARGTWEAFRPAVPTTFEGLAYAAAGMVAMLALYHLGVKPVAARIWRSRGGGSSGPPSPGLRRGRDDSP
jgi:hypothetical protein